MTEQAIDLTTNPLTESINRALTDTAPPCPECGAVLTARSLERHVDYHENDTGDEVTYAAEWYRCANGHRVGRTFELDRYTQEQREDQRDLAVQRAEAMDKIPFLAALTRRGWLAYRREVERQYPFRPDVDLMARYIAEREDA